MKQFVRRFREEENHHATIIETTKIAKKKVCKKSSGGTLTADDLKEIESETQKLADDALNELTEFQIAQKNQLEERFGDEVSKLEFSQTEEIFQMKLRAAKRRVKMLMKFHESERRLFEEREKRDTRTLEEANELLSKTNSTSQNEIFSYLNSQKDTILAFVSKESKKCLPDYIEILEKKINDHFIDIVQSLEKQYAIANQILDKRCSNASKALKEVYALHKQNLVAKCSQEMKEFQEIVSNLESQI